LVLTLETALSFGGNGLRRAGCGDVGGDMVARPFAVLVLLELEACGIMADDIERLI
jgi:hypothetical protein